MSIFRTHIVRENFLRSLLLLLTLFTIILNLNRTDSGFKATFFLVLVLELLGSRQEVLGHVVLVVEIGQV